MNGEARPHAMVVAHRYHQSEANFAAMTIDDQIVLHSIKIDGIRSYCGDVLSAFVAALRDTQTSIQAGELMLGFVE
jgi:hypothetical protein